MRYFFVILGIILILASAISYSYSENNSGIFFEFSQNDVNSRHPFLGLAYPLALAGIILIIIGSLWVYVKRINLKIDQDYN